MRTILKRVSGSHIKEGLILLLLASWLLLVESGNKAEELGLLRQSVLNMAKKGYYSAITLGRLWLCACAIRCLGELLGWQELTGG